MPDDLPNREAGIERIVDQSGGRAYFAFELARHLNSGFDLAGIAGTDLDEVLWSRVGRLSDEGRRPTNSRFDDFRGNPALVTPLELSSLRSRPLQWGS